MKMPKFQFISLVISTWEDRMVKGAYEADGKKKTLKTVCRL